MEENLIKGVIAEISREKLKKILDQMNKCRCKIEEKKKEQDFFVKLTMKEN